MKRLITVAMVAGILVLVLAATAFAAPPAPQDGQARGFGPGAGIHTPGTGLANGAAAANGQAFGGRRGAPVWAGMPEAVEDLLGLTQEKIQEARQAGQSLAQVAAGQKVSKDTLVNTILTAKKATLADQVQAGKLTQEQADAIYAHMEQQAPAMVDRTAVGPGERQGMGQAVRQSAGGRMGGRWNR